VAQLESILSTIGGGLNSDDSLLNSGDTFSDDYRYARNVRVGSSFEDNQGAVENLPSTLEISNYYAWNGSAFASTTPPVGTFTALSKLEDLKTGSIYYLVDSDNAGDGYILKFVKSERRIYEILYWAGLNFYRENIPQMCLIGDYLIFCDYRNPNRIVNVTTIYILKSTLASNFSEYHISFHKWSPLAPAVLYRSATGTTDYTKKGIFQFSYRYIYKGGLKSTFAPPTYFATNEITGEGIGIVMSIPGFLFDYEDPSSTSFQHSSIKFYEAVEYIEFSFRQSERDGWKLWKRYTVDSSIPSGFLFSNTGSAASVPEIQSGQYFDSVPFLSGSCEAIDNRPMFGNNLDEVPAVTDFDVEDVEVYTGGQWNGPVSSFSGLSTDEKTYLDLIFKIRQFSFKETGVYKAGIIFQHYAGRTGLVTTLDKWTYRIPKKTELNLTTAEGIHALGFNIPPSVTPPDWAVAYQIVRTNCMNIDMFLFGEVNDIYFLANDDNAVQDWITTPDGVKSSMSDYYDNTGTGSADLPLYSRVLGQVRKNKAVSTIFDASRIYFKIDNWILTAKKDAAATQDHPANNLFYNFLRGDRVRFMGGDGSGTGYIWYDEEIVDYTGKGIIINKPILASGTVQMVDRPNAFTSQGGLFQREVYRPKKFSTDDNVLFYEMGEWYPITQPRTVNRDFSKRDFRWSGAANVTVSTVNGHTIYNKMPLVTGDVWVVNKNFYYAYNNVNWQGVSNVTQWMQMNQDKFNAAGIWEHNNGRPLLAYSYYPQQLQKESQVRFGGKYLQDSLFIAINTFLDSNQFVYPAEYGQIMSMVNTSNAQVESVGNIMLIIGKHEAWSVYVNRTTFEDLSGRTTVSLSDQVLGSYNTLLGSHGTLNPESVSKNNGRVLWWDAVKGSWIRYSRDGLTEVSDIKMKNWFKDISMLIINEYSSGTRPKVQSVFDDYHNEWITRINHSSLPSTFRGYASYKCSSFAERTGDKRWKSIYDYAPDLFAGMDNDVYSIIGLKVHIHEEGVDFGKIYGSSVPSQIEFAATDESRKVKIWNSVAEESTDKWSFEKIMGDWKSNSATIQETRIPLTTLEAFESTYWATIQRDKNTPNAVSEASGVATGNPMRSKSLRLLIQLDPEVDYLSVFYWLVVSYALSGKNPKN